ncbi:MAG: exodeoxyribonuclease VII small subunit [Tissierellia bacterium]|nr:exodeoxyribonuclease VII small subunit [Tissierellia bacterium]
MKQDYEKAFQELESIIRDLESEDITLEESIKKYEEGIKLYKYCQNILNEYEGKVQTLLRENKELLENE